MRLTAQEVYDKLVNEDGILQLEGQIKFYLGDVNIIVKQRDVVGNIMQEWLQGWLDKRGIEYAPSENTQMPPDFFLNPDDKTKNLLEVKAFNRNRGPGFDIADFRMYEEEIINKPYELYSFIEFQGWKSSYIQGKPTRLYKRIGRNNSIIEEQKVLTEYIRHQIHHPENKNNPRYTREELKQSIDLMRTFIEQQSAAGIVEP